MKFLKKLLHLRILSLAEASPLVSILLKPGFALKALKRMENLEIKSSLLRPVRRPHPFGPGLYAALSHYPSLTSFTLQIERKANEYVPLSFVPHPSASQPFRRLRTLDLSGRLDENSIKGILFGCEALTELHLTDSSGDLDLVQAVRSLPSIASLRKLTLRSFHAEDEPPQVEIASFLREAPLLDSLNLLGPFDTTSLSFLEALYSLPLRTLAIGCNTPLLPQLILSLLHPKTRHPTLRALYLDNVFAIRGVSTHPDDISDVYFTEDGEPTVPEGWIPPFWPEDKSWTPEIVEQVREAADEAGVKTIGTTFDAAMIEEDFEEEVGKVEMYWEYMAEQQAIAAETMEYYGEQGDSEEDSSEEGTESDEDGEGSASEGEDVPPSPRRTLNEID